MWCWIDKLIYRIPWKKREKAANKVGFLIIICMIVPGVRHFVFSIIEMVYYKIVEMYYNHKAKKEEQQ